MKYGEHRENKHTFSLLCSLAEKVQQVSAVLILLETFGHSELKFLYIHQLQTWLLLSEFIKNCPEHDLYFVYSLKYTN